MGYLRGMRQRARRIAIFAIRLPKWPATLLRLIGPALEDPTMAFFQDMLVEHLPHLRAFALRISRDRSLADDLVQETMLRALCNNDKFMRGTNMEAWLSTILRNRFYDELRSRSHFAAYDALPH